ncbi:hypothetical protein [Treponema sp. C6A8]|uniref:hypothetical protein n=1 Tax=Treponema sp. C6A8 TaxID=1410609 RepID=UPI000486D7FF|nr:hypothetical protein [Treponema sp. C6A8]
MEITIADLFRYFLAYEDYEKKYIDCIRDKNNQAKIKCFHKYLSGMKISRNFKSNNDENIYNVTIKFIEKNPEDFNPERLSLCFYEAGLLNDRIKNAVVAASKILWVFNHDVIIMDSQAKNYLKEITGKEIDSYSNFCTVWEKQYALFKVELTKELHERGIVNWNSVFNEEWFLRRTFDNYLWLKGKNI